ncbi:hypothetical protein [Xanthomonas virus PB119]|nr:hypothetical protein [Xanthomonas virus PB119]
MDKVTKSKMVMALITPDLIEEWNTAVRARRLYFILDYTTHTPTLYIGAQDVNPEPWLSYNTKTQMHIRHALSNEHLKLGAKDVIERFAKHEAAIFIKHSKNRQKQQFASLGITANAAGFITTVLSTIKKGTRKEYVHFQLNERW